ncbi:MAG: hypothetical protein PF441_02080 [Desulfuromusa sp.]|nr:hypothetical protein [Desulfuromusa sp.]
MDINETIAAYQLLSLSGKIEPSRCPDDVPDFYRELSHALPISDSSLTEPPTEPVKNVPTEQDIQTFIEHWALSWREQNVANYLACYTENFEPKRGQEWREYRQQRLTAPAFIDLFVSDMQIRKKSATRYQVSFIQEYHSDQYQDQVRKNLLLEFLNGAWAIIGEQSQPISTPSPSLSASPAITPPSFTTIEIGPCINQLELNQVIGIIREHGLNSQQMTGSGMVKIFRLFEGVYPPTETRKRLAILKKSVDSAFILPSMLAPFMSLSGQYDLQKFSNSKTSMSHRLYLKLKCRGRLWLLNKLTKRFLN